MKKFVIIMLVLVLLTALSVSATQTQRIEMLDCGASVSSGDCGDSITYSCDIIDYTTGSLGITQVYFNILGDRIESYDASLTSGTKLNGTWSYTLDISEDYALTQSFELVRVYAKNANGITCTASDDYQDEYCYITFDDDVDVENNCTCLPTVSYGTCTIDNVLNATVTSPAGCPLNENAYQVGCDFCDPLWTAYYGACSFTNDSIKYGLATKQYTEGSGISPDGAVCCGFTATGAGDTIFNHNGGSDCTPPPDSGSTVQCYGDSWLMQGKDFYGSSRNQVPGQTTRQEFIYDDMAEYSRTTGSAAQQPLVVDIDANGLEEIVILKDGNLYVYNIDTALSTLSLKDSISLGTFTSVSSKGIEQRYTAGGYEYWECSDGSLPPCDVQLIVAANDTIYTINYTSGNLDIDDTISVPNVGGHPAYIKAGDGISCKGDYCYLMVTYQDVDDTFMSLMELELSTDTFTEFDWQIIGNLTANNPHNVTPILLDDVIVYWMLDESIGAVIYSIEYDGSDLKSGATGADQIVGATYNVNTEEVYVTLRFEDNGFITYSVGSWDPSIDVVYIDTFDFWSGFTEGCITAPASAMCGGYEGFAMAHYNGPELGVTYEYWGAYNWDETSYGIMTQSAYATNLDPRDALNLVDSVAIAGITGVVDTPAFIDSNGDGMVELWYADAAGVKVLDRNLNLEASLSTGGAKGKTFASDVNDDGLAEFVLLNGTYDLGAYKLNAAGTSIELAVNPIYVGAIGASTKGLLGVVYSTVSGENRYYIHNYTSTNNYVDAFVYSGGGFVLNDIIQISDLSAFPMWIGRTDDGISRSLWVAEKDLGGGDTKYYLYASDLDFNSYLKMQAFGECCGFGDKFRDIVAQPVDYFGSGVYEYFVAANVYDNVASYGTVGRIFSSGGVSLQSMSKIGGAQSSPSGFVFNSETFTSMSLGATAKSTGAFFNPSHINSSYYSVGTTTHCVAAGNVNSDEYYWFCLNTSADSWKWETIDDYGVIDQTITNWNDLEGPTVNGDVYLFDFTGDNVDDFIIFGTDNILRVYSSSGVVSSTNSFAECWKGDLSGRLRVPLTGYSCDTTTYVSTADVNKDFYWDELLMGGDLIDFRDRTSMMSFGSGDTIIPVDLNNDAYGDFLASGSSGTIAYLSNPPAEEVILSEDVEITRLQPCQITDGILSVGVWGTGFDPESIHYSLEPGTGDVLEQYYPENLFYYRYQVPGDFTVTATMCDDTLGQCDTATCEVESTVEDRRVGACTWYDDGTFDWPDSILTRDWFINPAYRDLSPSSGKLVLYNGQDTDLLHTASCNMMELQTTFKIYVDEDVDAYFVISAGDAGRDVAIIRFNGGNVQVPNPAGGSSYVTVDTYTENTWLTYRLDVDLGLGKFYLNSVSGSTVTELYSQLLLYEDVDNFMQAHVKVHYFEGYLEIDYIDIEGAGGRTYDHEDTDVDEWMDENGFDESELVGCQVDQPSFQAAVDSGNVASSFPHMKAFCLSRIQGDSYCDYQDLRFALKMNPRCYKEALNYCVAVTYPAETSRMSNVDEYGDGIMVCSTVLGTQQGVDKIVIPISKTIWQTITASFVEILIVVVIVIVFAALFVGRK